MENRNKPACEGNCIETHGDHKGEVLQVTIHGPGFDGMKFNYCQNAIEEDEQRGFTVLTQLEK